MASNNLSSGVSLVPASTITNLSGVPATTKLNPPSSISFTEVLRTNLSSFKPILAAPIGPAQGMVEIDNAIEAASKDTIAASFSPSTAKAVKTTCTSFLMRSSNNGRIDLSTNRPDKIASSLGRPSRLIKREPFILPAAYNFSSKSTINGK